MRKAAQLSPDNPSIFNSLALCHKHRGNFEDAVACLHQAIALDPSYFEAFINLGNLLTRMSDYASALSVYKKAQMLRPREVGAYIQYGKCLLKSGFSESALSKFQEVLSFAPKSSEIYEMIADWYEKGNRYEEARTAILQALELNPCSLRSKLIFAKIMVRQNNLVGALSQLEEIELAIDTTDPLLLSDLKFQLALVHDKLGNFDAAFHYYSDANTVLYNDNKPRIDHLINENKWFTSNPSPLKSWFTEHQRASWSFASSASSSKSPVFMVGFSRSGTTLLDQALDSHPKITTLEEKPTLQPIFDSFCSDSAQCRFENLDLDEIEAFREGYWHEVGKHASSDISQKIVIDRSPFYTLRLGHIHRFFPDAKFIVVLRDPRDVVLSNFMQNFVLTPATLHFFNLADAASYYASVMEMFHLYRKLLSMKIHFVLYENLIENFAGELQRLLEFLELPWDENVMNFQQVAAQKRINTASYHQVVKPLYKTALGRWQNYKNYLDPVLPLLAPHVAFHDSMRRL